MSLRHDDARYDDALTEVDVVHDDDDDDDDDEDDDDDRDAKGTVSGGRSFKSSAEGLMP